MKKPLREKFQKIANKYIKQFVKKHGFEFDYFIGDNFEIASFIEQYTFSLDDIRYDIDNECKPGLIFQWQDDCVEFHFEGEDNPDINFRSYSMGMRFEILQEKRIKEKAKESAESIKAKLSQKEEYEKGVKEIFALFDKGLIYDGKQFKIKE
jgi:hypothetical protein